VIYPALLDSLWKVVYIMFNTLSYSASYEDLPRSLEASTRIMMFVSYPIMFINFVTCLALFSRRRPVVPRKPTNMASKILYLCCSARLLQDVHDACDRTVEGRAEKLRAWKKGYAFGWFVDEERRQMRLGVEREPMEREYCYGQVDG
jgi:hypothetical protein